MPRLADPFQVKGLHLTNRLVMAPMATGLAIDHAPSEPLLTCIETTLEPASGW